MSNGGSYDPRSIEPEMYEFWERGGYFHAEPDPERKPYTIVIPPPNVTGALHLGHALNNTLQDILIRRARMRGYNACWLPGTDHAGIATQAVVEKRLRQEEGKTRHEIGREGLVAKIWEWKEEYNTRIINQLRRMGCSCDWQRTRFTLDEVCARAVYETFFRFFKDGLIYRGLRLVNWDTQLQTAVADDEVYHETVKSNLWHIRYPVLETPPTGCETGLQPVDRALAERAVRRATAPDAQLGRDYLVCATTRPETMLGDTAVAVHPDDERYRHLIGRYVLLPLMNRPVPVIGDGLLVKKEFGTGCVKVTPGHDPNDYACGQRHGLELINILTADGRINEVGGPYQGLSCQQARKKVVADLEAAGLMGEIQPYQHEVGHSDRSKTPIEPMLSEQWFVRMEKLAEPAMEAVRDGRVRFFPERFAKTYLDWLGERRDWCISRQLWWGHRIPVWRKTMSVAALRKLLENDGAALVSAGADCNCCVRVVTATGESFIWGDAASHERVRRMDPDQTLEWFVCLRDPRGTWPADDRSIAQRLEADGFEHDPDVLDTWFSSALWPHSTFGWPAVRPADDPAQPSARSDLDYFYPTNVLSTARDIISLWVARMVMTGLYNVGRVPFSHVTIHPTIQDGQGRRMSKSLNNGVDPNDIIDMYGTDAMRFTLAQLAGETQDIRMPVKPAKLPDGRTVNTSDRFELGRNFCNKLWQAATGFVLPNLAAGQRNEQSGDEGTEGPRDEATKATGRQGPEERERAAGAGPRGPEDEARLRPLGADDLAVEDRWILSRLSACIEQCDRRLDRYQYNEYINTVYAFFWSDFCDWYIEMVKPRLFGRDESGAMVRHDDESARIARRVLAWVLDQTLRLLHPATPFVTEALWNKLGHVAPQRGIGEPSAPAGALIVAAWPRADAWPREPEAEQRMAVVQEAIRALREIRTSVNKIRAASKEASIRTLPHAVLKAEPALAETLRDRLPMLLRLGQCEQIEIGSDVPKPPQSASKVLTGVEVYVPLAGLADLDVERRRLGKEREEIAGHIARIEKKLSNEGFVAKAPAAVVERERARLADLQDKLAAIERNLAEIGA